MLHPPSPAFRSRIEHATIRTRWTLFLLLALCFVVCHCQFLFSRFRTWRMASTMPSRKYAAGGVEPLDFAAADEAVGRLVEVARGAHGDRLGGKFFEAVQPHDFGLRVMQAAAKAGRLRTTADWPGLSERRAGRWRDRRLPGAAHERGQPRSCGPKAISYQAESLRRSGSQDVQVPRLRPGDG